MSRDLRALLRGDVEFDAASRFLYATDAGLNQMEPLGIVSPRDTDDVVRLVEYAAEHGIPLIGRGMGSGLAGGAVGAGIQVDFARYMNRVLEIAPDGSWARVQPGLVLALLNQEAAKHRTFFAPDPSSENYCSLGGMIGTNSSGARTVAYGGTKDHVLAAGSGPRGWKPLSGAALWSRTTPKSPPSWPPTPWPGGRSRGSCRSCGRTRRRSPARCPGWSRTAAATGWRRSSAARPRECRPAPAFARGVRPADAAAVGVAGLPDLVHLQKVFIGAEGTLGLITEATLNLVPLPRRRGIAMAYFPSVFASGEAVPGILALSPTAVEIMDSRFLALVRKHDSRVDAMLPERTDTALLIEFEGRRRSRGRREVRRATQAPGGHRRAQGRPG